MDRKEEETSGGKKKGEVRTEQNRTGEDKTWRGLDSAGKERTDQ